MSGKKRQMGNMGIMFLKQLVVELDHFTRQNGIALVFESTNHLAGQSFLHTIRFKKYKGSLHKKGVEGGKGEKN
jgi:hypothetical protein